jgi:CheY-like chemotaxis protein
MELSKLESGRLTISRTPTSVQSLIDEVHDLFVDQLLAKKIEFVSTVQPDLPRVFLLDEMHCRQILVNLVSNGVKFTRFGRITLAVTGSAGKNNQYDLRFEVTDTGIGMSREKQQEILDLFEQREPTATGMGGGKRLGLTLCSRLADMMGGSMRMESTLGKGSRFVFTLAAPVAETTGAGAGSPLRTRRRSAVSDREPVLLVVDDMAMISDIIRDYFAQQPVEVVVAPTSEEGLSLARSRQPDLILMDLNLAGVDGREAARRLRKWQETADIPVVVMTGRSLDPSEYRPDFDDLLAKPFHLDELERVVARYIRVPGKSSRVRKLEDRGAAGGEDTLELTSWTPELGSLLRRALESGSIKAARELGRRMREIGSETDCKRLAALGRRLEDYAAALDIIGVEQMLEFLTLRTGEKQ